MFGPRVGTSQEESAGPYALNLGFLHLLSSLLFFEGGGKKMANVYFALSQKVLIERFSFIHHSISIPYPHTRQNSDFSGHSEQPIHCSEPVWFSPIQAPWIYHTDPEPGMSFPEWPEKSERHFVFSLQIKNRPWRIKNLLISTFFIKSKIGK